MEIKQHSSVLHQPTKWLKELILQQAFRYEENRLLEINFQNARCTEDTNLNKYVNKKKSTGKVDMPPLGMKFIKLGLQDGLYDPESNKVIVLNTSKTLDLAKIKEGGDDSGE